LFDNIYIILVKPKYAGNAGQVARAMKNMGISNLRLVNPDFSFDDLELKKMAVSAYDIIENAKRYEKLKDAVNDISYIVGTSNRKRRYFSHSYTPKGLAKKILEQSNTNKTAIIFGPEDNGLNNNELSIVNDIITIPASKELSSLNIAQAVLIVCYEIYQKKYENGMIDKPVYKPAGFERKKHLFNNIETLIDKIDFAEKNKRKEHLHSLQSLISRGLPKRDEIDLLQGLINKVLKKVDDYK